MEGLSVLDMIQQGWYITYPLIVMSMVVITIIFERLVALRGLIGGDPTNCRRSGWRITEGRFSGGFYLG